MAEFLLTLYDNEYFVGEISTKDFSFSLKNSVLPHSGNISENQLSK